MNGMVGRLILRRLALGVLTLFLVSVGVFFITNLLPGDAAQTALGQAATPETVAALRLQFGLDLPAPLRYAHWLVNLLSGNPGISLVNNSPVAQMIAGRLPASLLLAGVTAAVSVPVALVLGIVSAMYRGSLFDRIVNVTAVSLVSVPEFLVATIAVMVFAVKLRWLSALSHASDVATVGQFLKAYAMPVMTLCCVIVAQMSRMTRAAVIDQLRSSYVEMALLKGVNPTRIVLRHALPNAIGPIANAVALSLSYLLGGVIIVETIFNYPGIATLMIDAVTTRDMPLVQACSMIFCAGYLLLVLAADVLAIISNPRLRNR
ncbi:ABC-type dipeptide/oligopeptide/nickel transport system, permease component [Herbaspirillum sp. CF444]|uniref:ABC transporter permease n=1 Tax=Herbaspirillum sp. CF444 TaxID=1144319 RepID=UPI0002724C37|nr:ABC transporter permease [Herbaspirillum sp. CF444]EJL84757.1 ABC-type dipeptide/oligopeptide/nickel transport system, permease component [Herbaspirillum sp. CF444]